MASVVVTFKVMPASPDVDLDALQKKIWELIKDFAGVLSDSKTEIEPIAFGLKALKLIFVMDEAIGSTEFLENQIKEVEGVNSVDVVDVRRSIG